MDNLNLVKKLPPMLTGLELEQALTILPEYDPGIKNENTAARLIALSDMYKVFVPTQMSKEIYAKMYLALLRSLQKKESKLAIRQYAENHRATRQQEYSGILGGSDSFTIIGQSGIGKSSSISRIVQLLTSEEIIEVKNPSTKIIPCVTVQTPFDSSVKGLLLEILRVVDDKLGSKYYANALRTKSTIDMLIGSVSQVALNHIGLLVVDEIQHVVNHRHGKTLIGCLTQLINNSGIAIAMVGTPESAAFFTQAMQLARRALGLQYSPLEYGEEFQNLCKILFSYQYVKHRTTLDASIIHWLYEHSDGNISTVVALLHDSQEIAILDGSETLDLTALRAAYQNRIAMLHPYITVQSKPQTSSTKKQRTQTLPEVETSTDEISISTLILRAKNECRNVVSFLQSYITVEEIAV